jgi:hypothetical protein
MAVLIDFMNNQPTKKAPFPGLFYGLKCLLFLDDYLAVNHSGICSLYLHHVDTVCKGTHINFQLVLLCGIG